MRRGENIYKRKDGRWEGRFHKGRKIDGKIKYGYVYGQTVKEVRLKLYPLKAKYQAASLKQSIPTITVSEWSTLWLSSIEKEAKLSTYASYDYKMKKYILPALGGISLNELTLDQCQNLFSKLELRMCSSSVKVIFQVFNQCLKSAYQKDLLKKNPLISVKLSKSKKSKINALSKSEQLSLEKVAVKEGSKGLPVIVALYTGLRIGELSALKWSDVDLESNMIHVNQTTQRIRAMNEENQTKIITNEAKTENSIRTVPIGKKISKLLSDHKQMTSSEYVFSVKNKPCEPRLITYHFHRIREKANLHNIHFHQLRHSFATRCLEERGDIASISSLLGHSSSKTTLDIYADSLLDQRKKIIYGIEESLYMDNH